MSSPEERPGDPQPEERADRPATGRTSGDAAGDREELQLAPIPAEGTSAPADADRVFGRPSPSSPYARIVPPAGMSQDNSAHDRPSNGPASESGSGSAAGSESAPSPGSRSGGGTAGGRSDGPHEPGQNHGWGQSNGTSQSHGSGHGRGSNGSPPSEEQVRRLRGLGRWALVLGIAGLLASVAAFPLGLALGIAAIVLGLRARRAGASNRMVVPGATPGLVLGAVATVFAGILTVTAVVFWDEVVEYQQCLSGANTQTARDGCQRHLENRIMDRVGTPN